MLFGMILLAVLSKIPYLKPARAHYHRLINWMTHRPLLLRHGFIGPFYTISLGCKIVYILASIVCVCLALNMQDPSRAKIVSLSDASPRAARMGMWNLLPLYLAPHLATVADHLGISLNRAIGLHRFIGIVSLAFLSFHMVTAMALKQQPRPSRVHSIFVRCRDSTRNRCF